MTDPASEPYIGRFAPSPTGPLHFGSLVAALASFLDARSRGGQWLLRMEDLDPPRNTPEAASQILLALESFGLDWDGEVLYQSTRLPDYAEALTQLVDQELIYPCTCSRTPAGEPYDGRCRQRSMAKPPETPYALRVRVDDCEIRFEDLLCGEQHSRLALDPGDFVVKRKDGLFSYQLAVAVDDAWQRITRVVRGNDLLDSTPRQMYLQARLGWPHPEYAHIPVVINEAGSKLSKQTFAPPLAGKEPVRYLAAALSALGHEPPAELLRANAAGILEWGIAEWDLARVPAREAIPERSVAYLEHPP